MTSLPTWLAQPTNIKQHPAAVDLYLRHGWKLIPMPYGKKGPTHPNWNQPGNWLDSPNHLPEAFNIGLGHAYSGTMALDVDNWENAAQTLSAAGIDLQALYDAPDAVTIESGKPGHGKLLYTMPFGLVLPSKKLNTDGQVALELRCGTSAGTTVQDVIPPSMHPETGQAYRWGGKGSWDRLPTIPFELLTFWQEQLTTPEPTVSASNFLSTDLAEVRSALIYLSPDCPREDWLTVGMGLHHLGLKLNQLPEAFAVWHEWSAGGGEKYRGQRDVEIVWNSFKATQTSITIASTFDLARRNGWTRPQRSAEKYFSAVKKPLNLFAGMRQLRTTTASDVKPKVLKWIWDGVLPKGKVVTIAGDPGVGKGVLTARIAAQVSNGSDWSPGHACEQGTVAFLAQEDAKDDTVVPRLMAAGADLTCVKFIEGVVVPNSTGDVPFDLEDSAPLLEQWLNSNPDVTVVIIDPINDFLGPNTDSYKDADVRQVLNPLKIMAERHNVTMVMVSHMNKGGGKASYRIMGAMAFTGVARVTMVVIKDEQDSARRLIAPVKANITKDTSGFSYRIQEALVPIEEGGAIEWVGHPVAILDRERHEMTAEKMLNGAGSGNLNDEIQDFLLTELSDGPVLAAEMENRCAGAGLKYSTVVKRKKQFGVSSNKQNPADLTSPWVWKLATP
jgi:putative DNA primase/helicase